MQPINLFARLRVVMLIHRIISLKLLSKDVFEDGRLEEAFKNSETNIPVINVSHNQFGDLFAAFAYGLDNVGFNRIEEFKEAIKTSIHSNLPNPPVLLTRGFLLHFPLIHQEDDISD